MGFTPPFLVVNKVAGGYNLITPSTTTGDDLIIYPNSADTTSYIRIDGAGDVWLISAGNVRMGTYSAGAATDSTGYITIKDAGGTSRKLMVQA